MQQFLYIIAAGLVCAAISFTITTTSIFQPFREAFSRLGPKLEELIHCPWCLTHYIAYLVLSASDIPLIHLFDRWILSFLFNLLFTWFLIICISGLVHYVLLRAYKPVAEAAAARKIENRKKNNHGAVN